MKKTRKILAMAACAVLLVCISVGATVAYLTSDDTVTNTFTVGNIKITLDEAKVNANGEPVYVDPVSRDEEVVDDPAEATRVQANDYHLIPGHVYTKDPTVHVDANAEECYLFVKVENAIAALESKAEGYSNIAKQMAMNGWVALGTAYPNVYYLAQNGQAVTDNAGKDYAVFSGFSIAEDAETDKTVIDPDTKEEKFVYDNTTTTINAYAVQADGFSGAAEAWAATFGKGE